MYRKPRFLEVLHDIREEMSRDADYDVELFAEMVRSNRLPRSGPERNIRGYRRRAPGRNETGEINSPPPARQPRPKRTA